MKYVHIMPNSTFTNPFIDLINSKFENNDHLFLWYGNSEISTIKNVQNTMKMQKKPSEVLKIIITMNKAEKIYLHGLFSIIIFMFLFLQPWVLKKCYWVIWGGDLYYHTTRNKSARSNVYEYLRRSVIKKMAGFITHIKGDYELAKKWYGVKGRYYYSFMYPSNVYKDYCLETAEKTTSKKYIQVGNSADPSNNHIEVLNKIERYKDMNIEVICPLSYGDKENAQQIINHGSKILGDKFVPIIEFMPFDKYLNILAKIDIAIFNHKRQQAMGNITTLLGLGKKVYIRKDITTWEFCIDHDLKVYSSNSDFEDLFEEMDEGIRRKNVENMKMKFSEEKLVEDWKRIFNEGDI